MSRSRWQLVLRALSRFAGPDRSGSAMAAVIVESALARPPAAPAGAPGPAEFAVAVDDPDCPFLCWLGEARRVDSAAAAMLFTRADADAIWGAGLLALAGWRPVALVRSTHAELSRLPEVMYRSPLVRDWLRRRHREAVGREPEVALSAAT